MKIYMEAEGYQLYASEDEENTLYVSSQSADGSEVICYWNRSGFFEYYPEIKNPLLKLITKVGESIFERDIAGCCKSESASALPAVFERRNSMKTADKITRRIIELNNVESTRTTTKIMEMIFLYEGSRYSRNITIDKYGSLTLSEQTDGSLIVDLREEDDSEVILRTRFDSVTGRRILGFIDNLTRMELEPVNNHAKPRISFEKCVEILTEKMDHEDMNYSQKIWAARQLGDYRDERAVDILCKVMLGDDLFPVRSFAAESLYRIASPKATDSLVLALDDECGEVAGCAARALARIGYTDALDKIRELMEYREFPSADQARQAYMRLFCLKNRGDEAKEQRKMGE